MKYRPIIRHFGLSCGLPKPDSNKNEAAMFKKKKGDL